MKENEDLRSALSDARMLFMMIQKMTENSAFNRENIHAIAEEGERDINAALTRGLSRQVQAPPPS